MLGKVSGARKLVGFDRTTLKEPGCRIFYDEPIKPAPTARHVIDIYKELLRSLGVTPGPHRFHLSVPTKTTNTFHSSCPRARLLILPF